MLQTAVIALRYKFVIAVWRVKAESRRGDVSFLQFNDSEAQAEIFYGLFYGRARFCRKTAQLCATHCETEITNDLASATICKAVKRGAIR
jgi:hypothetical protein